LKRERDRTIIWFKRGFANVSDRPTILIVFMNAF